MAAIVLGLAAIGCGGDDPVDGAAPSTSSAPDPASDASSDRPSDSTSEPSGSDELTPMELAPDDETFYDVPDPIPAGEHGALIRYQLTGDQPDGAARYRVMYLSETVGGEPTVVTGLVAVPDGDAPDGGWPVITYARGSSGIADDCAISRAVDASSPYPDLAAEAWLVEQAAARHGLVATITDYQGIGGPGIHPFLLGVSEARSVLDAARAAGDLPDVPVGDDLGIMGYSQGGHAALWAGQEAEGWTPELTVHGTVAGAPASEVVELVAPEGLLDGGSLALILAGLAQEDPELDLTEVLTPAGQDLVDVLSTTCRPDGPATGGADEVLRVRPDQTEPWRSVLEEQVPGRAEAAAPVLLVHGDADRNVPVEHSATLLARLCEGGTPAERRVVAGADHVAGAVPTIDEGAEWLAGRIDGTQPTPEC